MEPGGSVQEEIDETAAAAAASVAIQSVKGHPNNIPETSVFASMCVGGEEKLK
jgi:hypothetical protein